MSADASYDVFEFAAMGFCTEAADAAVGFRWAFGDDVIDSLEKDAAAAAARVFK